MIEPDRKEICAECGNSVLYCAKCGQAVLYGKQHLCGPDAETFTFSDEVDWLPMPKEENQTMTTTERIVLLVFFLVLATIAITVYRQKSPGKNITAEIPPKFTSSSDCWCSGRKSFQVQDETGQVFLLEQAKDDSNLYTVWLNQGETNGIKQSFSYRYREFLKAK